MTPWGDNKECDAFLRRLRKRLPRHCMWFYFLEIGGKHFSPPHCHFSMSWATPYKCLLSNSYRIRLWSSLKVGWVRRYLSPTVYIGRCQARLNLQYILLLRKLSQGEKQHLCIENWSPEEMSTEPSTRSMYSRNKGGQDKRKGPEKLTGDRKFWASLEECIVLLARFQTLYGGFQTPHRRVVTSLPIMQSWIQTSRFQTSALCLSESLSRATECLPTQRSQGEQKRARSV